MSLIYCFFVVKHCWGWKIDCFSIGIQYLCWIFVYVKKRDAIEVYHHACFFKSYHWCSVQFQQDVKSWVHHRKPWLGELPVDKYSPWWKRDSWNLGSKGLRRWSLQGTLRIKLCGQWVNSYYFICLLVIFVFFIFMFQPRSHWFSLPNKGKVLDGNSPPLQGMVTQGCFRFC